MNKFKVIDLLKYPVILIIMLSFLLTGCGGAATQTTTEEPAVATQAPETVASEAPAATEATVATEAPAATEATAATEAPATTEGTPKYGGVLKFALLDDPQGFLPHNTESCENMTIISQIWSSLLRYDKDSKLVGDLAESWEWQDDKTLIFHLRQNVKWHNGDPFTSADVVKSMEHFLNPKVSLKAEGMLKVMDKWEAIDDYTVKLTLKQADGTILRSLTTAPGQAFILHPKYDEATAGQSFDTTIGTGPFMFDSYEPGVSVKLVKNPNYFIEGMPYLDGLEFPIIKDYDARLTALRSGEVDMIEYIDFNSIATLMDDPNIYVPQGKGFYGCRLIMDTATPPTDDINVRKALNFGVDRQMIVDSVLAGQAAPIWGGMIPEGRFGYNADIANTWSFDPEKAKSLLAEAGWTDTNGDGLVDKDGKPLTIKFATYGPDWWSQVGEVVQANLKDIGVTVDLTVEDWAKYKEMRAANKDVPAGQPGEYNIFGATIWGLDLADMMLYNVTGGAYNFGRNSNPDLDALYLKAASTTDDAERDKLLQQAQAIEVGEALDITPAWITRSEGARKTVKNFYHLNDEGCYGILLWQAYLDSE
jgi:peptide/nickel transport system substrate-binding protein